MWLALASFILRNRVGVYAQLLGHLIGKEIKLLSSNQQLFSETEFRHSFLPLYRIRINLLRRRNRLPVFHRQPQRVFGNVFHRAEESDRVEVIKESEMCDTKDFA